MNDSILYWNQAAIDTARIDFDSPDPTTEPTPQQPGPTRTSRALAIVHLAMYDAWAGSGGEATWLNYPQLPPISATNLPARRAAVATAASLTLSSLWSRQAARLADLHIAFVATLGGSAADTDAGIAWGTQVAHAHLDDRRGDGSEIAGASYAPSPMPGRHRVDPLNVAQGFLDPRWGDVRPFGVQNLIAAIPPVPPPALDSAAYAGYFNEVKAKGVLAGGTRTPEETTIGLFWAYDGPRGIGVPPRLYNQAVRAISMAQGATEAQNARLFAQVNVAMADAGIYAWYEKYLYNVWRPVVGIREADAGWGPTGLGDGTPDTCGDPYWTPLGAPRTNQPQRAGVTPNFPAYPSGHATFGAAALRVAALSLGLDDDFSFEFVSEELDGKSTGTTGVRALHRRRMTIPVAIQENLASRVYLGVHWRFDGDEGVRVGELIAERVVNAFPGHHC